MALNVDRVAVSMDVTDGGDRAPAPPPNPAELREQIREVVVDVLRTELERVRRETG